MDLAQESLQLELGGGERKFQELLSARTTMPRYGRANTTQVQ